MADEPQDRHETEPDRRAALVHDLAVANDRVHDADEPHADAAGGEHEATREPDREGQGRPPGPYTDQVTDGPAPTDPSVLGPRDEPDRILPQDEPADTDGDHERPPVWHDGPQGHGTHR
ncbi:hypothetical protein [Pseudonocardia sp. KRD291]|uniref:hypothetical protein n=1 Tax=Pseudonocardia sp. KRD291 TaxID=2792007 RepID=UPI001C49F4BC|nr:hypothetical protein [Pseudonocardia sp. KRD291]MBW0104390.1 hypothetical protein [Pseudonocardia sp. KRD291]